MKTHTTKGGETLALTPPQDVNRPKVPDRRNWVSANAQTQTQATILVVDDAPENLTLLGNLLKDQYKILAAINGRMAMRIATAKPHPDLILLDVVMPLMDGYEVCAALKADPLTQDIPVIFLTSKSDPEDEQRGLDLGAVDYVTKPVSPPILYARVRNHLALKAASDYLRAKNFFLTHEVRRRSEEVGQLTGGLAVHEINPLFLTEVVVSLNRSFALKGNEPITLLASHEDLLRAAFPELIDPLRDLLCQHDFAEAGRLLKTAALDWDISLA